MRTRKHRNKKSPRKPSERDSLVRAIDLDRFQKYVLSQLLDKDYELTVEDVVAYGFQLNMERSLIDSKIGDLRFYKFINITRGKVIRRGVAFSTKSGLLELRSEGAGVLRCEGSEGCYVRPSDLEGFLSGDEVLALKIKDRSHRDERVIPIKLTERVRENVIVVAECKRGVLMLRALGQEFSGDIVLDPQDLSKISNENVVCVRLKHYDYSQKNWSGVLEKIIGSINDPGIEIDISLIKHGIPEEFTKNVEIDVKTFPERVSSAEINGRKDLRSLPFITIDGEDAKDFDDAVFVERCKESFKLHVAIADVSHYVTPSTNLDIDAAMRGTSVYFPNRVVPMLPEVLSNGICSLKPDVDRLVVVASMEVSREGSIANADFALGVIHSKKRLTYAETDKYLSETNGKSNLSTEVRESLLGLRDLTNCLLEARRRRGCLEVDIREPHFIFNDSGGVDSIVSTQRYFAHQMIEEAMLCANVSVANFLKTKGDPFLHRVHPDPDPTKIGKLMGMVEAMSIIEKPVRPNSAGDLTNLMEHSKNHFASEVVQSAILRAMSQAYYTPEAGSHYGLGYERYVHFTSPIRRYPDLLIHRSLKNHLGFKGKPIHDIDETGKHCSMTERRAEKAVRWSQGWLGAKLALQNLGHVFEGRITNVTQFGCFVLIDSLGIEGLLHIADLGREYFNFDSDSYSLCGDWSGKSYQVGANLSVRIHQANMETGKINLKLGATVKNGRFRGN